MAVTQSHYRFGVDELAESTHGWYAAEDANPPPGAIALNKTFLLRFTLQCDGTLQANVDPEFQYRKNGGTWTQITTGTSNVKAVTPVAWADTAATTKRLSGTGTFIGTTGCTVDGIAGGTSFDIAASGNGETECALQLVKADLKPGDLIEFRLTRDGAVLIDTYAVTPGLAITEYQRAVVVSGPFPIPRKNFRFRQVFSNDVAVALSGVAATIVAGVLSASPEIERPRIVRAPNPFPSAVRVYTPVSVSDVTLALSGVSGTGAMGTLVPTNTEALAGSAGTGSVGTLTPTTDTVADLSGVSATGSVGSLSPSGGDAVVDRPRIVRGPFPFPKTTPAFTNADRTLGLTGVEGLGQVGSLIAVAPQGPVVDRPHRVDGPIPFLPSGMFQFQQRGPFPAVVQGAITLALSGVAGTSAVGTLGPTNTEALTGTAGTGNPGTLAPTITLALAGVAGTSATGNLSPSGDGIATLSGVAGTGSVGTLTPTITVALAGVSSTGSVGTLTPVTGFTAALTGVSGTGSVGTLALAARLIPLVGSSATGAVGIFIPLGGSDRIAALTGVSATASAGILGAYLIPRDFFIVAIQDRWFVVTAQGRWFIV